jgi:feruloyl esterase
MAAGRTALSSAFLLAALAGGGRALAADNPACAALASMTAPGLTIVSATTVSAGRFTPPDGTAAFEAPAFCRIVAKAKPTPKSDITIEIWSPPAGAWNGKFLGVGSNAFRGNIAYPAMADGLRRGYAVAATDTGHVGDDLSFAKGAPEKGEDWAWRSTHLTAQIGKLVVRNHQGRFPTGAYFAGCDTGGHQALTEAQRFPEDYDGIVAGNPAADRVREIIGYLGVWRATHDAQGRALLSHPVLQTVTRAAVVACDGIDGVKDGVIDDPRRCAFDPASLICKPGMIADCLTPAQAEAVKAVHVGVRNPRTGELIFAGWPVGSEGFGPTPANGWSSMVTPAEPRRVEFFRFFLFHDPDWDWRTFDLDRDTGFALDRLPEVSAVDTDLRPFVERGGKLIMYTGWADPILSAYDITNYYEASAKVLGPKAQDSYRLFMAPGVAHCSGGPGPDVFDMLPALEAWVEKDAPPSRVIASRVEAGQIVRTRPLCPYPQVAAWDGKGDTDKAASFACVKPRLKAAS